MNITIFAATGGIGREALRQALGRHHNVTVVVRDPARLPAVPDNVRVLTADLAANDGETLTASVADADAVLSCLGAPRRSEVGIAARGTRAILDAMTPARVRRLIAISAAPVATIPSPGRPHPPRHDPGDGWLMRHALSPVMRAVLRPVYLDLARMEDHLRESALDWSVVRPPRLTNGPLTATYRTAFDANVRRGLSVSRADVAHCMLELLERPETARRALGIAS